MLLLLIRVAIVALFAVLPALASGCAYDGQIPVRFSGAPPVVVTELAKPEQSPHRLQGVTTRNGQVVGITCAVTIVYDVREATGSAVLIQRGAVHLRTRRLRRGTSYAFDCMGPLIVELPVDASGIRATATDAAGKQSVLPVQAAVRSVPVAFGKRLRPEADMQLDVVGWPQTLAPGEYQVELAFDLPNTRTIRQKAVQTASVSCGHSRYLQPILPIVTGMARVPAFTIEPSTSGTTIAVPHIAGGDCLAGRGEANGLLRALGRAPARGARPANQSSVYERRLAMPG